MRNTVLSYLLLPLLAGFSLSASAAQVTTESAVVEMAKHQSVVAEKPVEPKLKLNSADASTLERELKGIGRAKAESIVSYREANGPFTSLDELLEVKGIGSALLERNREKLTLD
ncbi:helix-hairpin-helix domain-containing protein [Pseudomonas mosselii]|uniref:ComEA family DNA-binding protein n=1 Tax=Pseudomonas mosselii TaxID=78327 RepID=UPI00244A5389|nr:helix-hairpin-helix domain-containing protein [Pseudomonas mosselii]MDH1657965.1 helix-hairpin-helix domain-containing protein [Pseudomonas mosselii]MDH1714891.1 helix-hairpin-helix domain-containing protein [Pseudomonas mosselii]MDH1721636.1 helix-hairpin-helix domain-containing protein [Pseudomonas mosselii]